MANTPYYVKAESDALNQEIKRQFGTGIIGSVTPNVAGVPQIDGVNITQNGIYIVSTAGDYGTITGITLVNKIVLLEVKSIETTAVYNDIITTIPFTIDATVIDGSANAVSGNGVFDYYNRNIPDNLNSNNSLISNGATRISLTEILIPTGQTGQYS